MSIRGDARQEAERRYPIRLPYNRDFEIRDREQKAFEAGAVWRDEQADREPSERLMVAPAIQAVRDVLDGLEDWEIQDHALGEIRSALDDIPDCVSATAIPHEEHGEPCADEVSDHMLIAAMNKLHGYNPPVTDIAYWSAGYAENVRAGIRTALLAAQEVRNRG